MYALFSAKPSLLSPAAIEFPPSGRNELVSLPRGPDSYYSAFLMAAVVGGLKRKRGAAVGENQEREGRRCAMHMTLVGRSVSMFK